MTEQLSLELRAGALMHVHAFQLHRPGVALPVWRSRTFIGPKCVASDESCGTP